jgi:hypothetical protein
LLDALWKLLLSKSGSKESILPIQLNEENEGNVLLVHVDGKLAMKDYERVVPQFERLLHLHGKLNLLFDMTGFHGWTGGAM